MYVRFWGVRGSVASPGRNTVVYGGNTACLELNLNGSAGLTVVPVGRSTEVDLNSPWLDPKFDGAYLPVHREVGPEGFAARWAVSYYGRGFGQNWASRGGEAAPTAETNTERSGVATATSRIVGGTITSSMT